MQKQRATMALPKRFQRDLISAHAPPPHHRIISFKPNSPLNSISFRHGQQSDNSDGPTRKKSILHNPLTPQQQQQQLHQVHLPEPIVTQPAAQSAPAIIPHLQTIYGESSLFSFRPLDRFLLFFGARVASSSSLVAWESDSPEGEEIKDFAHFQARSN